MPFHVLGQMPAPHVDFSDLVAVIIIPAICLLIGWLVWVMNRASHLKVKAQIELQTRLLEKIRSAQDVAELIKSEEGRQFINALSAKQPDMMEEILASVRRGIIFTTAGAGGFFLRLIFPTGFGVFIIASILMGAIGVGFLISSAVTYRLSKSWGLIAKAGHENPDDRR